MKQKNHLELISVVVPVYNVERFLEKCITGIINQTYTNFELILVDDGSTDQCPEICNRFADKDQRIRVIHKENGGLSSARNKGIELVNGNYVTFIDSDDWIDSRYLEYLYKLVVNNAAQISVCDLYDSIDGDMPHCSLAAEEVLNAESALELMFYQTGFTNSASGKMFVKDLIPYLTFPVGKFHEDLWTIYKAIAHADTVAYGRSSLYCYLHHNGGISHSHIFDKNTADLIEGINEIETYISYSFPKIIKSVHSRKFSCIAQILFSQYNNPNKAMDQEKYWSWIVSHRMEIACDKKERTKNMLAAVISFFGKNAFLNLYKYKGRKRIK